MVEYTKTEYYVYVHRRKDDGLPFYIGKGKRGRYLDMSTSRSRWHKSIVKKHGVIAEILIDQLTEEEAFGKEIELIEEYQTKHPDTMCNFTRGGDGYSLPKQENERRKQMVLSFIEANNRPPSYRVPEEKQLFIWMMSRKSPSSVCYDPEFKAKIDEFGLTKKNTIARDKIEERKKTLIDFIEKEKRIPTSKETVLYSYLRDFSCKGSHNYDPQIRDLAMKYNYCGVPSSVTEKKKAIVDFISNNNRLPSQHNKDEARLYHNMKYYCTSTARAYDPEFATYVKSFLK